jgi:hypothetical protein
MISHTDQTAKMIDRLKAKIALCYAEEYSNIKYKITEPTSKNKTTLKWFNRKLNYVTKQMKKKGFIVTYNITAPTKEAGYNCMGCRKRKTGDFMWVGVDVIEKEDAFLWFYKICKVCSKECGELMILRLM